MKMTNKISKKLIVSTLSTVMGVSLVGAITGTVAWYQYSTRSTVSFVGTTIRNSENLQVSFEENGDFVNDLSSTDIAGEVTNTELLPVTTGAQAKDAALPQKFYANPIYQKFGYNEWIKADANAYVQFTVYLKLNKIVNNDAPTVIQAPRKVYLGDFVIQDDRNNQVADISEGIRVHLHSDHEDMLLGKTNDSTIVYGKLDLNEDGKVDTEETIYDFTDLNNVTEGVYGEDQAVQTKYEFDDVKPSTDAEGLLTGDHYLGTLYSKKVVFEQGEDFEDAVEYFESDTLAANTLTEDEHAEVGKAYYVHQDALPVTVTIWLEGWQKLRDIKRVQLPQDFNLDTEYFEDNQLQQSVTPGTIANGAKVYYVDDGNGNAQQVTPDQGTVLNAEWYSDIKLENAAHGQAEAGTFYYYVEESAMWDAFNYATAKFDVGLMFEVDA